MDDNDDDSDDEEYPGAMSIASRDFDRGNGQVVQDEDEDDEQDHVHVVQQNKGKKLSDLKRKSRNDEDDDEDDENALRELVKNTKGKQTAPAAHYTEDDEDHDDDDDDDDDDEDGVADPGARRETSYRLWCKNAHRLFKVVDVAVVRESRHAVVLNTHTHYGQLVSSNADSLWYASFLALPVCLPVCVDASSSFLLEFLQETHQFSCGQCQRALISSWDGPEDAKKLQLVTAARCLPQKIEPSTFV